MLKLTSIKILEPLYNEFKRNIVWRKMSLQKMLNRSMYLYTTDNGFKENIHTTIVVSGSHL